MGLRGGPSRDNRDDRDSARSSSASRTVGPRVRGLLRSPLVIIAFVVERLRHLPAPRGRVRYARSAAGVLFVAAVVFFLLWGAEKSPARISLSDLAAGRLSAMQSWIIVSGDLVEALPSSAGSYRYRLVDTSAPGPSLIIWSPVERPLGPATVSGYVSGGYGGVAPGQEWVGQLAAEAVLAQENPPPWEAIAAALAGWFVLTASHLSYPVFFRERPRPAPRRVGSLRVAVRRDTGAPGAPFTPATLMFEPESGAAVTLTMDGSGSSPMRLHSEFTGISVGELRGLSTAVPALRLRRPSEDLTIRLASRQERDAAYAALVAEAKARLRARPGSGPA